MSSLIKNLQIKNFKSVRDLSLDCDRVNIFIGKPNAGKSNILEAISLLGVSYPSLKNNSHKFLESTIRYKTIIHLFNNFNARNSILVNADDNLIASLEGVESVDYAFEFSLASLRSKSIDMEDGVIQTYNSVVEAQVFSNGNVKTVSSAQKTPKLGSVKKYQFTKLIEEKSEGFTLLPPNGDNFFSVVESNPELRSEITDFLKPNGFEFLIDLENQRLTVVQKTADTLLSFPLNLVPDTFQRYIFHTAAIMSNRDSVLLFEEPEAHSYGPYIYQLAQQILNDEGGNQYFITTHNPYFLLPIMQESKNVAVFATWFEDYQTFARQLSEDEIREMLDYGVDVFLNLDHFIPA